MTPAVFGGFPEGRQRLIPVPSLFFRELLPAIDDLAELKVTLYAFWALNQKEGTFRCLRQAELAADALLLEGLRTQGTSPEQALREALDRAVARGTFLQASFDAAEGAQAVYFLNTPKGRAGVQAVERGEWRPDTEAVYQAADRPNVFRLYEENIGPLTPLIADTLRDAEETYPAGWIEEAVRIAVENNVRKWRYVQAILEDWRTRGRDEREDRGDSEKARRRYIEGKFADFIEH